jgi:hypothetical protein
LLPGLTATIGVLVLLARSVLTALLAAVTLIVLAALLAATLVLTALVLLALVLIHRYLLGVSPRYVVNQRTFIPFREFRECQIFLHA